MKAAQIILKNYDKLLSEVKSYVEEAAESISKIATRKKIEMAWKVGRSVQNHLKENNQLEKSSYGKHLFERLENEVGISQSALYKMSNFYKSYPKLPADDDKLNWSHYRVLAGVKDENRRKYLEDLTRSENLDAEELGKKLKKSKSPESPKNKRKKLNSKLNFRRGKLFCYNLTRVEELGFSCIEFCTSSKKIFPRKKKLWRRLKMAKNIWSKNQRLGQLSSTPTRLTCAGL